jgi:glycosyltransferase involved in cell wall biosynthesis
MRISLLYRDRGASVDGIRDYTTQLAGALGARGADVSVELLDANRFPSRLKEADAVIVQYNPFSYGRWGVAPWLPAGMHRVKGGDRGPLLALMVHEPYMPLSNWRAALMGGWQRLQMVALRSAADVTFVSIERWVDAVRRCGPRRSVHHLPVGSTLPDMRSRRDSARVMLKVEDPTIVLTAFGTGHPSRLTRHIEAAATALHEAGHDVVLLNLGAGAPRPEGVPQAVPVETPGRLESGALATYLSAADIFVAPFIDGVSARRSTFIAALQHALPIVAIDGPLTDRFIRKAARACRLVPSLDPEPFAGAVVELARRPREREQFAQGARLLYEQRFAWPVIADQVLACLENARSNDCR